MGFVHLRMLRKGIPREKEKELPTDGFAVQRIRTDWIEKSCGQFLVSGSSFLVEGCRASLRTFQASCRCVNFRFRYRSRFRFRPPSPLAKTSAVRRSHPLVLIPYADRNVRAPFFLFAVRRSHAPTPPASAHTFVGLLPQNPSRNIRRSAKHPRGYTLFISSSFGRLYVCPKASLGTKGLPSASSITHFQHVRMEQHVVPAFLRRA